MKNIFFTILLIVFFTGCSGKTQINPITGEQDSSLFEKDFYNQKKINEALNQKFKEGESVGYEKAKAEFEKIIPYLESIRASAELQKAGGICSGPLFIDKSSESSIKLVLGNSHICDNFTVERVLKIVKSGIPGLPDYVTKGSSVSTSNNNATNQNLISNVSLVGVDKEDFFIENPESIKPPSVAKISNTETNRQILRESNVQVSSLQVDSADNNKLLLNFPTIEIKNNFCSKFNICMKD